jgi:hypothetical protein
VANRQDEDNALLLVYGIQQSVGKSRQGIAPNLAAHRNARSRIVPNQAHRATYVSQEIIA